VRAALTVAVAQPRVVSGDVVATVAAHAAAVRRARARLVVFPELSLTGYELAAEPVDAADPALAPLAGACSAMGALALVGAPVAGDHIAMLAVDGAGARVAYRKSHPGGDELARFAPGDGPTVLEVDGWRVGLGICRDTGIEEHIAGTAALGVDLFVAGVVHHAHELEVQNARAAAIAQACAAPVALASFAGATGGGYAVTAGRSTILAADGTVLARAGTAPGDVVTATLG
jgi:predicted amidohydrolase